MTHQETTVASPFAAQLSFMLEDEPTTGAVKSTEAEKQQCAKHSLEFNCKNLQVHPSGCSRARFAIIMLDA